MTSEDFFESIQKQYHSQLPFVAYRKPNATAIKALLQTNDVIYKVENYHEKGFVFAPFDDFETSILMPLEHSVAIETSYENEDYKTSSNMNVSCHEEDKNNHVQLIEKGIKAIDNHHFEKVVLSRQEIVSLSHFSLMDIVVNLINKYPLAFAYCWYHPKVGLWLGATPETLMKIEGHQFSMMALAGTQDYKGTLNVVWNEKEKKEQQIVTDFITDNLKPFVENIHVSEVETVKAGNLVHLKTMIKANLKIDTYNLKQIVSVLHPTPAVCGLPKLPAKQFILENEGYKRTFYTGFLGELNYEKQIKPRSGHRNIENRAYSLSKKCTQLYVNLRCMQIIDQKAYVYVGGGITKASNPEREWEETVSKSKVIKSIL
ncbi:chorismate-binding protein [Yeosuana sp. AK3]